MGSLRLADFKRQEGPGVDMRMSKLIKDCSDWKRTVKSQWHLSPSIFSVGSSEAQLIFPKKDMVRKMPLIIIAKVSS